MDPGYVESVWWSLQQIHDKGLLAQDHRVAPYCPRCGTGAVRPRAGAGLRDGRRPVGLRAASRSPAARWPTSARRCWSGRRRRGRWCPTPRSRSTPTSPTSPRAPRTARCSSSPSRCCTTCSATTSRSSSATPAATWSCTPYRPPFDLVDDPGRALRRRWPTTSRSRTAPAWSTSPPRSAPTTSRSAARYGLPVVNPVTRGRPLRRRTCRWSAAQFFKKADAALVADLAERGLLFKHVPYEHSYPHCWRCHTPLLYYAQPSWYIRTTADQGPPARGERADQLVPADHQDRPLRRLAEQQHRLGAVPQPLLGHAAADLALRRRPRHRGRLARRARRAGRPRPVRRSTRTARSSTRSSSTCPECGAAGQPGARGHRRLVRLRRRCRSRSGATRTPGVEEFESSLPRADFICEAIDQTRGWFYTLMAVGTLVFDRVLVRERGVPRPHPRRGGPQDVQAPGQRARADPADGRPRRRRRPLVHGGERVAVAVPPGRVTRRSRRSSARRCSPTGTPSPSSRCTRARRAGTPSRRPRRRSPSGRCWTGGRCPRRTGSWSEVDAALEAFDTQRAGRLLSGYVDDLSNWYVRRSRRRFWAGDSAALATLHECLYVVTLLMAPLVPFVTERVWQDLFAVDLGPAPGLGAPGAPGRRSTARWSTTGWPSRWRWCVGWSSSAGPPGPAPG